MAAAVVKKKVAYKVIRITHTGKREEIIVDANRMSMLDGINDTMVLFHNLTSTVYALPFGSFESATLITVEPPKAAIIVRKI